MIVVTLAGINYRIPQLTDPYNFTDLTSELHGDLTNYLVALATNPGVTLPINNMPNKPVATGWTVLNDGELRHAVYKVQGTRAILTAAALTQQLTFCTPLPKWKIINVVADVTQVFAGGGATACTLSVDDGASVGAYIVAADVFTAPMTLGIRDIDLGIAIARATIVPGGFTPSRTVGRDLRATFTTTGANVNQLTTGSVTFEVDYLVMP